jgi:hypothetical protein
LAHRLKRCATLVFACGSVASCGASSGQIYTDRTSRFTTFSDVVGTATVRWSGGSSDYVAVPNTEGTVAAGACKIVLHGDVLGRVDAPERFLAQPSRVMVVCNGAEGAWQFLVITDNLTRAEPTDVLKFDPEIRGPASGCTDDTTPVTGSVAVVEAVGAVDVRTVSVPADFVRRVRVTGHASASSCGLDEITVDFTGEIRPEAFNFSESRGSLKE